VDERDSRVSQGSDGVMSLPRIPGLVHSRTPVEIEEEVRLGGNLSMRYHRGVVG